MKMLTTTLPMPANEILLEVKTIYSIRHPKTGKMKKYGGSFIITKAMLAHNKNLSLKKYLDKLERCFRRFDFECDPQLKPIFQQ